MPKLGYWILGVVISLAGVALARLVAPAMPADYQLAISVVGITVAIVGVLATALGAGRR